MKITIWDGREFEFDTIESEDDIKKMYRDELLDLRKDIADERDNYDDMDDWGLVLDEVLALVDNEIADRKSRPKLDNNFLVEIVDNLEDWLDKKGVKIPNEERDAEDPDNEANFYGDDFSWFMEMMRDVCLDHGVVVEDEWE